MRGQKGALCLRLYGGRGRGLRVYLLNLFMSQRMSLAAFATTMWRRVRAQWKTANGSNVSAVRLLCFH